MPPISEQRHAWFPGQHGVLLVVSVCCVYVAALSCIFPGYFDPLYAIHSDVYFSPGLSTRNPSLTAYAHWPRPAGYFAAHLIGLTGLQGSISLLVVITLLSITLTVVLVQKISGQPVPVTMIMLYAGLAFSHPQFYVNYVHDALGTISYLYVVLGMVVWQSHVDNQSWVRVVFCAALFVLAAFTKETYFITAPLFFAVQLVLNERRVRRSAGALLTVILLAQGVSLYWNLHSTEPFMRLDDLSTAYAMNFTSSSIVNVVWFYLKALMTPGVFLSIIIGLYAAYCSGHFLPIAMLCLGGICALLPHTPLPDHLNAQYAWTAAPLALTPVLFISKLRRLVVRGRWVLGVIVVTWLGCVVISQQSEYGKNEFYIQQERINKNVMEIFPKWKNLAANETQILVTGLLTPVHPFHSQHYVAREFGMDRTWTLPVGRQIPKSLKGPVNLTHPEMVDLSAFDRIFSIGTDGHLIRELSGEEVATLRPTSDGEISEIDVIMFPALREIREALRNNPEAWYKRQEAGLVFWHWGLASRAESMLHGALLGDGAENPYPYFYLGRISEWRGEHELAKHYYGMAIEREAASPNPVFRKALDAAESPHSTQP